MKKLFMVVMLVPFIVLADYYKTDWDGLYREVVYDITWYFSFSSSTTSMVGRENGNVYWIAIGKSLSGSITIPSMLGGKPVTSIGGHAFDGCSGLTSVTIPSSVTSIGEGAFGRCSGLTTVTIPSSVTSIGDGAFAGCSGLTSVTIPSSVTSIGGGVFSGCISLTAVSIPSSVTSIGGHAFDGCSGLTSVSIPSSVTSIDDWAFDGCSFLASLMIPSSVTSIGVGVFNGCSGLTSVTIPSGVTSIGHRAFFLCSGLKSVTIPSSVTYIGDIAFSGINSEAVLTFDGPPPTADGKVGSCRGYYKRQYAEEWTAVLWGGYWNGLKMQELPGPEYEFEYFGQTGHAYVKSYSGTAERVEIPSVVYVDVNGWQVADEASAAKAYQVTGISNSAFARNKTMKSVVFPASIQTIGSEAFSGCESLEQVTIPETVTSIGESAFAWCPKLKRAEVLGALELSANCFAYDSALETVVIGDKVTSLQKGYKDSDGALGSPFLGCEKLREISVGSGITYIEPHVFNGLKSLETIRFGVVIRGVYHHAFSGCESLKTIVGTLRPSVVGDEAFSGVPAYFGAQFDDCASIGTAAFWNCRGFGGTGETHTLDLPKITSIGDGAFEGCVNMSAVQLGAQLETIGANAFKDSGVQIVCFDGPPPSVGEGAFALPGEPRGVLRNWDSWQDWQSAIDINTGMWHGLHFSWDGSLVRYTFKAINDVKGSFDPMKVTAIVNKLVRSADGSETYVELERRRLYFANESCDVRTSFDGDYEVWFVYDDETWECASDVDRFLAPTPQEPYREKTIFFRMGNPAWTVTVYLYADEKATEPYAKLSLSSSAEDTEQDFPAPELSPVELSIDVLPQPPWPTPTWLYEFSGWRRRQYNVQSGKWETGDPIPATVYLGQSEIDQGNSLHLVATWKWDLGGGDDFKTWEEVQTEEYDKVVVKSAKIKDGETSEFSVTVEDEGVFSFLWKTSTESGRKFASVSALRNLSNVAVSTWDHAEFLVDGEVVATRDGESQWEKVTVNLSGGSPHTVTWRYAKDASGSAGEDCVWVSDIQLAAFPELVIKGNVLMGFRGTVPDGYKLIIPDGVTAVVEGAFANCVGLLSVKIPSSVTSIGASAFVGCSGLKTVTVRRTDYDPSVFPSGCEIVYDIGCMVKSVEARQRHPWNGLVDIVVMVQGLAEDVANAECLFVATNGTTKAAIPVEHITRNGADTYADGVLTRRFVWDARADVGAVKVDDIALTVGVRAALPGVQLWENGPYWAECNVGATQPEESGYYFWWGDTVGYKRNAGNNGWISVKDSSSFSFISGNCPTYGKSDSELMSEGYLDSTGNLVAAHDAATAYLGAPWRMPTDAEFSALISSCTTTWTTRNGVNGLLVSGKGAYASKAIFLPAAGYGYNGYLYSLGSFGLYWSTAPRSDSTNHAIYLYSSSSSVMQSGVIRSNGPTVRPIRSFADEGASVDAVTTHLSVDCQSLAKPTVEGDEEATVTGDAETGFVVKPSEGKTAVEVTIPQGVDAAKVTVEVSPKVASVKPNGAKVKVVVGTNDITEFLNVPAAEGNGVVDLTKATVKEEIVKEAMDVEKGAKIVLDAANPSLTTPNTRVGLFYQLREGVTIEGMVNGDSTIGNGLPWSPEIKVKGGNSAFYSIDVGKGE